MSTITKCIRLGLVACLAVGLARAGEDDQDYSSQDGRPMLGIEMSPVPLSVQGQENLTMDQGVLVRQTFPGTAAASMGIQPGDVVLSVNGAPIGGMTDLRTEVGFNNIGDPVDVVISRHGSQMQLSSQFQEWPASIPFDPLDPAVEKRFKDWQRRHMERNDRELARLQKQIDDLRDAVEKGPVDTEPRAVSEAKALLAMLPAWRLDLDYTLEDVEVLDAPAADDEAVVAGAEAGEPPWRVDFSLDSTKPTAAKSQGNP
jgi:membrane-associated protease RseP (regulator of RpoE activity)